jgi:hypothetical protein
VSHTEVTKEDDSNLAKPEDATTDEAQVKKQSKTLKQISKI